MAGRFFPLLETKWSDIFSSRFKRTAREFPIIVEPTAHDYGRIDYVASTGRAVWLVEVDMAYDDKWHWTKILACRAAYSLDHPVLLARHEPKVLVVLPNRARSNALLAVLGKLNVEGLFLDEKYQPVFCTRPTIVKRSWKL